MNPIPIDRRQSPEYCWVKTFFNEELAGQLSALRPEHRALVNDLRMWGFKHNGLPTNEADLLLIAQRFLYSKYRFRKYWDIVKVFFIELDGRFFYEEDIEQCQRVTATSTKYSTRAKRAADARWQREPAVESTQPVLVASDKHAPSMTETRDQNSEEESSITGEIPPPPPTPSKPAAADSPSEKPEVEELTSGEHEAFCEHCREQSLPTPSRDLCKRLKKKFSDLPVPEILKRLTRSATQQSPGLWDHLSREQIENLAMSINSPPRMAMAKANDWDEIIEQVKREPIPGTGRRK